MFKVGITYNSSQLKKKGDIHPIYELRFLLNRRITVEEPLKRKGPPQCLNCQEFGYTKSFCKLPTVCVRCGDIHKSLECPYSKTENSFRKCSNCGQNHTANYRGCPVYRQLLDKSRARKSAYPLHRNSHFLSLPNNYTSSIQHGSNLNKNLPHVSYAHAVSQNGNIAENNAHLFSKKQNKGSVIPNQTIREGSAIPTKMLKNGSIAQKSNVEDEAQLFSYAHVLKEGSATPYTTIEVNSQSSIEKLIETMNSFMTNMQNMFQQLMQNQSMLMQILLSKK